MRKGGFGNAIGILGGLLTGFTVGVVIEGLAWHVGRAVARGILGLTGCIPGSEVVALRWAQAAGLLIGVIGVWLLARRLAKAEGPQIYRPGRTWLEMEYEVQDTHKENEKTLRESDGEEHRMPRPHSGGATLWMDIGLLLSALLPAGVTMLLS